MKVKSIYLKSRLFLQVNAFSFGFVFGDVENVSIDLRSHYRFHTVFTKTIRVCFHLDPLSRALSH